MSKYSRFLVEKAQKVLDGALKAITFALSKVQRLRSLLYERQGKKKEKKDNVKDNTKTCE